MMSIQNKGGLKPSHLVIFIFAAIFLASETSAQLPSLPGMMGGLPSLGDGVGAPIQNQSPETQDNAAQSVSQEERAAWNSIVDLHEAVCINLIKFTNTLGVSHRKIQDAGEAVCKELVKGTGEKVKNVFLAKKMINILGLKLINANWVYSLLAVKTNNANIVLFNSNIKEELESNTSVCWSKEDNCKPTEVLKTHSCFVAKWNAVQQDGWTKLKTHIQSLEDSASEVDISGGRRLLFDFSRFKRPAKKTATSNISVDSKTPSSQGTIEDLKMKFFDMTKVVLPARKINKADFDKATFSETPSTKNERIIFVVKDVVRKAMREINQLIRKYEGQPSKVKALYFTHINFDLTKAKERCESKYGKGNCKKMNRFTYCWDCGTGFYTIWTKGSLSCACEKDTVKKSMHTTISSNKSLPKNSLWSLAQKYMSLNMSDEKIKNNNKEAFHYQVEDYYN